MIAFEWNPAKNEKLKEERGISFEDILVAFEEERLLDVVTHPNHARYPSQQIFIVEVAGYCYMVPFILHDDHCFLKTIIPSRKMTKEYLIKRRSL